MITEDSPHIDSRQILSMESFLDLHRRSYSRSPWIDAVHRNRILRTPGHRPSSAHVRRMNNEGDCTTGQLLDETRSPYHPSRRALHCRRGEDSVHSTRIPTNEQAASLDPHPQCQWQQHHNRPISSLSLYASHSLFRTIVLTSRGMHPPSPQCRRHDFLVAISSPSFIFDSNRLSWKRL